MYLVECDVGLVMMLFCGWVDEECGGLVKIWTGPRLARAVFSWGRVAQRQVMFER